MNGPLVSLICICKNRSAFIRQCVESVLNQDYENFEFLIQDGASTDGTVEIIREYHDDRIKLVSEPDSGPGEAIIKVLQRISGDIWGSCLSDEELLPHAVGWAVENFASRPKAAMIYGDCYVINENSALVESIRTQQWDYEKYLCCELVPPLSATFFRTDCFRKIGYDRYNDCGEFDIWLRMGRLFQIEYIPEFISRFRRHKGGNTSTVTDFYKTLPGRITAIEKIVDDPNSPPHIRALKQQALAGLHLWVAENFLTSGNIREAGDMIVASFNFAPRMERLLPICRTFGEKVACNSVAEICKPAMERIAQYLTKQGRSVPFTGGIPVDLAVINNCSRLTDALSDFCMTFALVKTGGWIVFDATEREVSTPLHVWDDIARHALSNHGRCGSLLFGQKTGHLPRWIESYVRKLIAPAEGMRSA